MRIFILNAVDVSTKFKFSYAFKSMSSRNTVLFFKKLENVYPYEEGIEIVQTDNGSEFLGEFDKYLKEKGIKQNFIYPRCPRINGYVERANRTLQDEFINENIFLPEMILIHSKGNLWITSYVTILKDLIRV